MFLVEPDGFGIVDAGFEYGVQEAFFDGPYFELGKHQTGNTGATEFGSNEHAFYFDGAVVDELKAGAAYCFIAKVCDNYMVDIIGLVVYVVTLL